MARPFDHIPDELKKAAQEPAPKKSPGKGAKPEPEKAQFTTQHRHKRPFQKTRAGVPLTKDEVKEIRQGRKALRKELRSRGIKDKTTFELYAGEQGLYFDKRRGGFLLWLLHGRGLWAALGRLSRCRRGLLRRPVRHRPRPAPHRRPRRPHLLSGDAQGLPPLRGGGAAAG